jgi:tetratricopeptide (TPR) repeat protein
MRIVVLAIFFISYVQNAAAQRAYSYCRHAYCHELNIYTAQYTYFTPGLVKMALNDSKVNPYMRLYCESTNEAAAKFYKAGFDSLNQIRPLTTPDNKLDYRGEQMRMALIYFRGAVKHDPDFCDAQDRLVHCYFLLNQYDSAMAVLNRQRNPSFHSKLAKGVLLYEIQKNYIDAEEYFKSLISSERTPTYYYYLIQAQIELNKLDEAKANAAEMEKCLTEWGDGWAMMEKKMFLLAVIHCKKGKYDDAYFLLDRIKRQYDRRADYCHYFGMVLTKKMIPDSKRGEKYIERSVEYKYNPDTML